jgi:hypothetical protein
MSGRNISHENGYSETIVEHFDHAIVANDVLEVDKDRIYSETNIIPFYWSNFS